MCWAAWEHLCQRPPTPDPPATPSAELHGKLQSSEAEVRGKCEELRGLHGQLDEARAQNSQLTERIRSIEALLEASQAQDAQVSTPLPGPLHPPHRAPPTDDLPSEACVLVIMGLFSRSRPVEWRPTSSRPGKRGQGPILGVGSRGGPLRSPVFPTPPPVPVGSRKEGRTQPVGRVAGPPTVHPFIFPSISGWEGLAGWGFSPCLREEGF